MTSKQLGRFMAKVDYASGSCWTWTGQRNPGGYGRVTWCARGPQSKQAAHRASYEHFIGPIPVGLVLDHLCRNRACVNPTHVEPVTCRENIRRGLTGTHIRSDEERARARASKLGKPRPWTAEWKAKLKAASIASRRKGVAA